MNERMMHPLLSFGFAVFALALIWGELAPLVNQMTRVLHAAIGAGL